MPWGISGQLRMDNFIIVIGSESSGTRLVESIFNYTKLLDDDIWEKPSILATHQKKNYVIRRSLPHYAMGEHRKFFNPIALHLKALELGYNSRILVTVRDATIATISKVNDHNKGDVDAAKREMVIAKSIINTLLSLPNTHIFSYETFMFLKVPYLKRILEDMNVDFNSISPTLRDGNKKYINEDYRN